MMTEVWPCERGEPYLAWEEAAYREIWLQAAVTTSHLEDGVSGACLGEEKQQTAVEIESDQSMKRKKKHVRVIKQ